MNEDREGYEYQLTLLLVRMRVKFPCKMKFEHQGNLFTADVPSTNNENRYIFNQELIIKNQHANTECFQFVLHLVTDKGARYIGGVIKLYHSELIRSQGEKLIVSLSKCVDPEAFCEVKVNRVITLKDSRFVPFDRKSSVQRNFPSFKPKEEAELTPFRNAIHLTTQQSKSQYNFQMHQSNLKPDQWDNRTKVRHPLPPTPTYSRPRTPVKHHHEAIKILEDSDLYQIRDRNLETQAYKEGYLKLKEKYKKDLQIHKQEHQKRLATENNENNLKLQVVRLKIKLEQQDKILNQKATKIKELQNSISPTKQKGGENNYLLEEIKQRQLTIEAQSETIVSLTTDLTQMREMTRNRGTEETFKIRQLKSELNNLRIRLENKERQLQHQIITKREIIAEKDHEIELKQQQLERSKRIINDLQKEIQGKNLDLQKSLQNDRSNNKSKIQQLKFKVQKLERESLAFAQERKELNEKIQELKAVNIKIQYEKKLVSEEYELLQQQSAEYKNFKEKLNKLTRQNKIYLQERAELQHQIERLTIQKEEKTLFLNQQLKEQTEYFRTIIKDMEQRERRKATEVAQTDSQLQQAKNQLNKQKRTIDSLTREVQEYKEREKNAKKAVKNKEQQSLGIETEHATLKQKLKTIDQIYKLQIDKIKQVAEKHQIQLEQSTKKLTDLQNAYDQLSEEHNKIKTKLQYAEQRSEKDSSALKDKNYQLQNYIQGSEQQISDLEKTVTSLRASEKELTNKLQRIEVETLKKDERLEKSKKDLRIFQQKCNNYEITIKARNNDYEVILSDKQLLQAKLTQKEAELNQFRFECLNLSTEKSKLVKINQLIQQNLKKLKNQSILYLQMLQQKQRRQENLLNQSKNQKQQYIKIQFALNSLRKDYDRNKEAVYQNIQKYFLPLTFTKEEEQTKNVQKSPKTSKQMSFSDILTLITTSGKQLKHYTTKLNDQNKQLQRQQEKLHQNLTVLSRNLQDMKNNLNSNIVKLEEELQEAYDAKQAEKNNFTMIINELNQKLEEKTLLQEELNTQIQEHNFTINSIKLDSQSLNEQNTKRMATLRRINLEWEEKSEHLLLINSQLQDKNVQLSDQIENLQAQLIGEQQKRVRREKNIEELRAITQSAEQSIQVFKKKNKQLTQHLSDCQLYLSSQKQINLKLKQSLDSEQKSCFELKAFISQLMKQKQIAIRNDLEKNDSFTNLENKFIEQVKINELLQEENERLAKSLDIQKESNKQYSLSTKQLEEQLRQEKNYHIKTQEKLREKQKQSISKDETIKKIENKLEKMAQKLNKELKDVQEEFQKNKMASTIESKQKEEKILSLTIENQRKELQITIFEQKINNFEEQLFDIHQKYLKIEDTANVLKAQNEELKIQNGFLDNTVNELSEQIKQRQEKLFEYSGKNYTLQLKFEAKESEVKKKIDEANASWGNKVENLCEEYEQKIDLMEKERDYFKSLCQQRDKEVTKAMNNLKAAEYADNQARKAFEDKTRKQQEEKLVLITSKNLEIQKHSEEIRHLNENIKSKESEVRRTSNELEIAKKTIASFDSKSIQNEERMKNMVKVYQVQIEQLKKKDSVSKSFREAVSNHQWNCQRQTKKIIQNFIRSFLEVSEDNSSQKVIDLARNLETTILQAVSFTLEKA